MHNYNLMKSVIHFSLSSQCKINKIVITYISERQNVFKLYKHTQYNLGKYNLIFVRYIQLIYYYYYYFNNLKYMALQFFWGDFGGDSKYTVT